MVVELRQYTLHPGRRDVLIELFEREFVESQEALGIRLIGWFRELDDPNRFVWVRSFRDMPDRARALEAFYGGPIWAEHRDAANATMIDSDDVLLLRPVGAESVLSLVTHPSPIVASIHQFPAPVEADAVDRLARALGPAWATLVTEESENNFAQLPVREGEHVVVRFSGVPDPGASELLRLSPTRRSRSHWIGW